MSKKSGVGKLPNNGDFKPKKIPKFGDSRQTSKTSFRVPKPKEDLRRLDDKCGFEEINDNQNLLDKRGRKTGEIYLPDPVEVTNFNSQALRYDRALNLDIDKIYQDANGRTVYAFCSKNSPTGFWEVTSVSGTFLDIPNPNLVIICPRPFTASELLGEIKTDGTTFRWSQLQGRTVIISPREGDVSSGVLNPTIVIIGTPSTFDPPILLLLELLDNPLIFRIVQVVTTPTSDNFGKDIGSIFNDIAPEFKVSSITPAPTRVTGASVYRGEAIAFTWSLPINSQFLIIFSILQNSDGAYNLIDNRTISDRQYTFLANNYYQIRTNFKDEFQTFTADSETFYWQFPVDNLGRIFADDSGMSKSVSVCNENRFTDYLLQVINLQNIDVCNSKSVSVCNENAYTNYQLGGIIIG